MLHVVILSSAHPISGGEREEPPSPIKRRKREKERRGKKILSWHSYTFPLPQNNLVSPADSMRYMPL